MTPLHCPSLPRACISGAGKPSTGALELCQINDQYLDGERRLETKTEADGDRRGGDSRPAGPGIKARRVSSDTSLVPAALWKKHSEQHQRKRSVNINGGELTINVLFLQSSGLLEPPRPRSSRLFLDSGPAGGGNSGRVRAGPAGRKGLCPRTSTHTHRQWTLGLLCPCSQDVQRESVTGKTGGGESSLCSEHCLGTQ